jgi:hypothetical protein
MNSLVKEIIKNFLPEEEKKQITALYAGGFKPPTAGHFEVVKEALKQNPEIDEFIIFIGAKERDGISQDESLLIWEIYNKYLPFKVKIEPSSVPPVKAVYDFAKNHPTREVLWILGAREENEQDFIDLSSRTKSITNYPNIEVRTIITKDGVSGTAARNASKVSFEKFEPFLPSVLTPEEKQEVYKIVSNKIQENIYTLDIPKFNYPKLTPDLLREALHEITLSVNNAAEIDGDLTGGRFTVGDITYIYEIKALPNPYKDGEKFFNISFAPQENSSSIPQGGKENYIKILSTMYKIIVDFIEVYRPGYVGLSSLDNEGYKNYHTVYNNLADNKSNRIPGYFKKDAGLDFSSPQGTGKIVVLKRKQDLKENASYSNHIDYKQKIKALTKHMLDKGMNIMPLPKVVFKHGDTENAKQFLGKTAYYNPETVEIVLYTEGRHPKDIVRSFSHEMIHHIQNLEGRLGNVATTNTLEDDHLDKIEQEANLNGTMTFRNWTDSLNEAIVGNKIVCDNCGWSWNIKDGGINLFVCHKCGHDNAHLQEKKSKDPFGLNAYAMELARLREEETEYTIYCDMDGVLVDFDRGYQELTGITTQQADANGTEAFWAPLSKAGAKFWITLDWMSDGKQLWDYIKKYNPILLSAPSREESSKLGKRVWVKRELPGVKLILKYASQKQEYASPTSILIDDRQKNIDQWEAAGGIGILHTNTANTIKQLQQLGL